MTWTLLAPFLVFCQDGRTIHFARLYSVEHMRAFVSNRRCPLLKAYAEATSLYAIQSASKGRFLCAFRCGPLAPLRTKEHPHGYVQK